MEMRFFPEFISDNIYVAISYAVHILMMVYVIFSACRSGKKSLGLYKHIIVRVSFLSILSFVINTTVFVNALFDNLSVDTSDGLVAIFSIFGLFGATAIVIIVIPCMFLLYSFVIGVLWIIYGIIRSCNKRKNLNCDDVILTINEGESDNIVDIQTEQTKSENIYE